MLVDGVTLLAVDSVTFLAIHSVTLLSIDSVTLALRNILKEMSVRKIKFDNNYEIDIIHLAFLLRNSRAFSLIDHRALLLWNIFTDFVLHSVTFSVMDNLAFGHSVGDTLLLGHGLALPLVPGGALLDSLGVARFFMSRLLNSSGDIDTLQLLGVVALFLLHGRALLADIICCGTISLDL